MSLPLIQHINVDITESYNAVAYATQYDSSSRIIYCHILNEGVEFDLTNYNVSLLLKKANGYNETIDVSKYITDGNVIALPLDSEMTHAAGRIQCTFKLTSGTKKIHTNMFYIRVASVSVSEEEIEDSDSYKDLDEQYRNYVAQVERIMATKTNEIASETEPSILNNGDFWLKLL